MIDRSARRRVGAVGHHHAHSRLERQHLGELALLELIDRFRPPRPTARGRLDTRDELVVARERGEGRERVGDPRVGPRPALARGVALLDAALRLSLLARDLVEARGERVGGELDAPAQGLEVDGDEVAVRLELLGLDLAGDVAGVADQSAVHPRQRPGEIEDVPEELRGAPCCLLVLGTNGHFEDGSSLLIAAGTTAGCSVAVCARPWRRSKRACISRR